MTNGGLIGLAGSPQPYQPLPRGPQALAFRHLVDGVAPGFGHQAVPDVPAPGLGTIDGSRAVFVGDSLTVANGAAAAIFFDSYATHVCRASGGRVRQYYNAGHGGYTSTQLVRHLQSEVWDQKPSVVFLLPGRNDTTNEGDKLPRETFTYVDAVRLGCALRGIPLVLVGQPPNGTLALGTPTAPTLTGFTTGGTLAANTYRYKVAWTGGFGGETLPSAAASVTTTGSTGSVRVDFPINTGASQYKVYKETTPGSGTYAAVATLGTGSLGIQQAKSWLDTGAVTPSGSPAASDGTAANLDTTIQRKQGAINLGLSVYARKYGLLFAEVASSVIDATAGTYAAGLSNDGTHPVPKGARLVGEAVWTQVGAYFRSPTVVRARTNTDVSNRVGNALLMNGTGSPTSWTQTVNTGAGVVTPTLAAATGFAGQAFTIGLTDGTSAAEWTSQASNAGAGDTYTAVSNGDVIEWSAHVKIVGADTGGGSFYLNVLSSDGNVVFRTGFASDGDGILSGIFTPLNGNQTFQFVFGVRNGPVTASIGELCLVNLSRTGNV